ncbi:MAG: hypothetical protein HW380_531 [Magnetococcales bacterium]|nr:hypothetical protein [Magnetococcales bacterium]
MGWSFPTFPKVVGWAKSGENIHRGKDGNLIEQGDDSTVVHAYTARRNRLPQLVGIGGTVDVDIAFPAVYSRPSVDPFFQTFQPKDSGGDAIQA